MFRLPRKSQACCVKGVFLMLWYVVDFLGEKKQVGGLKRLFRTCMASLLMKTLARSCSYSNPWSSMKTLIKRAINTGECRLKRNKNRLKPLTLLLDEHHYILIVLAIRRCAAWASTLTTHKHSLKDENHLCGIGTLCTILSWNNFTGGVTVLPWITLKGRQFPGHRYWDRIGITWEAYIRSMETRGLLYVRV